MANPQNLPGGEGYQINGPPVAGTSAVFTITVGAGTTGGSFQLMDAVTGALMPVVAWSSTDATLIANIKAAVESLAGMGNTSVVAGTGTSGIGTYLVTYANGLALAAVNNLAVFANNLVVGTVAVSQTTVGVNATARGSPRAASLHDYVNCRSWVNAGTATAPVWVRSERRIAAVPLAGLVGTTGGGVGSWSPPEGGPVLVTRCLVYTTTKSTGAANLNVGTAVNVTTSGNNLLTALDVGTAVVATDNLRDPGASGKAVQLLAAGSSVTFTGTADTTGLVGTAFIEYLKP